MAERGDEEEVVGGGAEAEAEARVGGEGEGEGRRGEAAMAAEEEVEEAAVRAGGREAVMAAEEAAV